MHQVWRRSLSRLTLGGPMTNNRSQFRSFFSPIQFVFCFLLGLYVMPLNAQTDSSWNGGTGNWSNSANWTPSSVPNNGGGTTYNVAVAALNSAVSLDVSTVTINNVSLAASTSLTTNLGNSRSLVAGTSTNNGTIENSNAHLINNSNSLFMNFGTLNN